MQQNCNKNALSKHAFFFFISWWNCVWTLPICIERLNYTILVLEDNQSDLRLNMQYLISFIECKNILLLHFAQIEFWKACPSAATLRTLGLWDAIQIYCVILLLNSLLSTACFIKSIGHRKQITLAQGSFLYHSTVLKVILGLSGVFFKARRV